MDSYAEMHHRQASIVTFVAAGVARVGIDE
jgi:hypothetical protein